ncbi:MAG TPA: hypothetical protein H9761_00180 [Candidatus Eisenbergiella merdavium]|uniref:Essential protein Yae1 N-terminal domain-containing protein n=1 Tax=Candidatus Eisenbergiella merdavium TaxID=2838551 RepID=A0A9D2NDN6_9FIRM|nr:hypothetical protein [Candidatus Eisenbergiella merdavium]
MSIFEYNEEEEMRKLREGERQLGKEEGKEEGIEIGMAQGLAQGLAQGFAQSCLFALKSHGPIPKWLEERITEETDPELMNEWMETAVITVDVESFLEKTGLKAPENE